MSSGINGIGGGVPINYPAGTGAPETLAGLSGARGAGTNEVRMTSAGELPKPLELEKAKAEALALLESYGGKDNDTASHLSGTIKNLGSLNADEMAIDTLAFMKIFMAIAKEMRAAARENRTAELNAQVAELNHAAEEMKVAADLRLTAGIIQGAMGIAQGVTQMAGGAIQTAQAAGAAKTGLASAKQEALGSELQLQSELQGMKGDTGSMKINREMAIETNLNAKTLGGEAQMQNARAQATGQYTAGAGGAIGGLGGIAGSVLNHQADLADIRKTGHETAAKVHETAAQHADDMMKKTEELINDIKEKQGSFDQMSAETSRGIARNMA